MKIEYIDTHTHLTHEEFEDDLDFVLERMNEKNVGAITIGTDLEDSKKAIELAEKNENVWAIVGFHPIDTKHSYLDELEEMEKLIQHPKCVGVGECGLDFYRPDDANNKEKQIQFFEKQIELAIKYDKPLMIHCRDAQHQSSEEHGTGQAWDDVVEILSSYRHSRADGNPSLKVNFHFFNQDISRAKQILDLGFQVSFTGIITFVPELEETVKFVPIDKIMSETDAPFAAPKPYRGSRNEPAYVIEVVKEIAEIRELPLEEVKRQLIKNAEIFWNISLTN
jgi:TatD DNase family protein